MTKKEMFTLIATVNADNSEIVDFCNREIELLSKRSGGSKTPTKTQKENVNIKAVIAEVLTEMGKKVTVTELLTDSRLDCYTNQKMSALLRQMVEAKVVTKTIEGKKAYFEISA